MFSFVPNGLLPVLSRRELFNSQLSGSVPNTIGNLAGPKARCVIYTSYVVQLFGSFNWYSSMHFFCFTYVISSRVVAQTYAFLSVAWPRPSNIGKLNTRTTLYVRDANFQLCIYIAIYPL